MARQTDAAITLDDAHFMVANEGFVQLDANMPTGNKCLTRQEIEGYLDVQTGNFSSYAMNRLVPYHLLVPVVVLAWRGVDPICEDDGTGAQADYLTVVPDTFDNVTASGTTLTASVSSNISWTVTSNDTFLTVTPASGTGDGSLSIVVGQNTDPSSRTGTLTLSGAGITKTITVNQVLPDQGDTGGGGTTCTSWDLTGSTISGEYLEVNYVRCDGLSQTITLGSGSVAPTSTICAQQGSVTIVNQGQETSAVDTGITCT